MRHRLLATLLAGLVAGPASARIPIVETTPFQMSIAGYLRAFTGYQRPAQDIIDGLVLPEELVLHAQVTRLELKMSAWDIVTLEVHSRFYWLVTSEPLLGSGGAGVGVSTPPPRTVDLSSVLTEGDRHRVEHDIDRLALRFFLGPADLSIGRQAVSWGTALLFGVSDLWTTFSPFDLDTSQKRGIDAVRAVIGVSDTVELDLVLADRGSVDDLSGGLRATFYLDFGDVYVASAKIYDEVVLAAGVSAAVDTVKLRAEVIGLFDIDDEAFELPRATLGVDWFQSADFVLGVEGHFNGEGAPVGADNAEYLAHALSSEPLSRGEVYLMGRWYAGMYANYKPHPLVSMTLSTMMNLTDPTAMLTWSLGYEIAQDVDFSLGGLHGLGDDLELGGYGQLVYLQLNAFF